MSNLFSIIGIFFGWLLEQCCNITGNFGWAVWLFTFFTKIILLPISIMVQLNSIKMVKMYPEMNRFKVKYFGDKDMISEAQYELYKREGYHPVLDLVPVIVQLILLMGVVEGIKQLMGRGMNMDWLGLDLAQVPITSLGIILIIPIAAAVSALVMCVTQNISNVLQSEQNMANKMTTLTISVGLSLYLGLFVPAGIGLYWIAGNLLSIVQMYLLNFFISPKKHIDYAELEASKIELNKLKEQNADAKKSRTKEEIAREKADYKRFVKFGHKQVVFYSERNGFYKYYRNIIEYILNKTDIEIHYITSDLNDEVFKLESDYFHTYYIGDNKFIVLAMKIEADVMVMTTPDLQNYQIKRSYVDKNIEYIYVPHDVNSSNTTFHANALDGFDTIFTSGFKNKAEIKEREEVFKVKEKNLVEWGSSVIDNMIADYNSKMEGKQEDANRKKRILIAPSWQTDNILDSCIDDMLANVDTELYDVTVRPHPQYVRHFPGKLDALEEKYAKRGIVIQRDFSSNATVYSSDVLITDWSSISFEYAFATLKPVLFVNTPMKIVNPDYEKLSTVPIDLELRDVVGISVEPDETKNINTYINTMLYDSKFSKESMAELRDKYIYNIGKSGQVGGTYIINAIIEKSK